MKNFKIILTLTLISMFFVVGCNVDAKEDKTNYEEVFCTEEQKQAEFCTLEYMPVCGNDNQTYGNACSACASGNIDYYVEGKC